MALLISRIQGEIADVIQFNSQERISDHIIEQTVDVSAPQIRGPSVDVAKVIPQERVEQHALTGAVEVRVIMQVQAPAVQVAQEIVEVP